jgi:hypothetical protein
LWVLLSKEGRYLTIAPTVKPTGEDLLFYKGHDKSSVAKSHIYIGRLYFLDVSYFAATD